MLKVKNSGYSKKIRKEVLDSAQKAFKKMTEDDLNGVKPMFRSKEWNFEERQKAKLSKKRDWWNSNHSKIKNTSVLFVAPTPGGVLAKELRKREAELNKNSQERIKIVEKGGMKIKDILCSKNPFQNKKCFQKTCALCTGSKYVEVTQGENKFHCS